MDYIRKARRLKVGSILEAIYDMFRGIGSILEFIWDFLTGGLTLISDGFNWLFSFCSLIPDVAGILIACLAVGLVLMILNR